MKGRRESCAEEPLISCTVKITIHQLLNWGLAVTEKEINSRRERIS